MSKQTTEKAESGARASAVSRIIKSRAGARARRLVLLGETSDGMTTVWTPNAARHQAAALSAARRALLSAGYRVRTFHGKASLPFGRYAFYLTVTGKEK